MIEINPFKTNINKDNELCLICHCDLNESQNYEIPECSHKYHTECIVEWFRSGNSNCPYCNSKYENLDNNNFDESYYRRETIDNKYKIIKKYTKNEACPKILCTKVNSIVKMQNELNELKKELKETMLEEGTLKKMQKKYKNIRSKIWKKQHSLYKKKKDLVLIVNIVPIIVPNKLNKKKSNKILKNNL